MPPQTFLLGAGFNVDARRELGPIVGKSIYVGEYEIETGYPLVFDLWRICFDRNAHPGESLEEHLAAALGLGDFQPLDKLLDALMQADYYIAQRHAAADFQNSTYKRFLSEFAGHSFLTFNYDSLVEIILLQLGSWSPLTGFGMPVVAHSTHEQDPMRVAALQSQVLHLHGSVCLFASDTYTKRHLDDGCDEICMRDIPEYRFDPDSTAKCFPGWRRALPEDGDAEEIRKRIIAPVPNKAPLLTGHYSQCIYANARQVLASNPHMVAIGYGFSAVDVPSYAPLIDEVVAARGTLTVVDPNGNEIAARLRRQHPGLAVSAFTAGFAEWYGRVRE